MYIMQSDLNIAEHRQWKIINLTVASMSAPVSYTSDIWNKEISAKGCAQDLVQLSYPEPRMFFPMKFSDEFVLSWRLEQIQLGCPNGNFRQF